MWTANFGVQRTLVVVMKLSCTQWKSAFGARFNDVSYWSIILWSTVHAERYHGILIQFVMMGICGFNQVREQIWQFCDIFRRQVNLVEDVAPKIRRPFSARFLLWGHPKECIYNNPHSKEHLKTNIDHILRRVARSMVQWVDIFIRVRGPSFSAFVVNCCYSTVVYRV
jgi:hypothetical protein